MQPYTRQERTQARRVLVLVRRWVENRPASMLRGVRLMESDSEFSAPRRLPAVRRRRWH